MVLGMGMGTTGLEAAYIPYSATTWIHQTPETHQNPSGGPSASTTPSNSTDDWSKDRSQASSSTSASTSAIDLQDSSLMVDMQAMTSSSPPPSASMSSVQALYHSYSPPLSANSFYAPFNMMPYGQPWASQASLPLSSYSTLNGATSSTPSSQSSQRSPSVQPMMIDPSLTMSNTPQSYGASSSSSSPQHHHSAFQHQFHGQPQLSINPMFVHSPSQQQQQQQQRTLSPSALHSAPVMGSMMQPMYYHTLQQATSATPNGIHSSSTHSSAPAPSAQESKQRFQDALKALLVPSALTGDTAVRGIVSALNSFGAQDVDAATRLEVVTKIRDNAGNTFFRAWADNTDAMDIFREWLKAGATGKDDGIWEETIMPLLHVIDRLPLTIERLKTSKLGKIIMKLMKEPPSPAIKDMASNIERKWRQLVAAASDTVKKQETASGDDKTKKRKLSEVSASKTAPPSKKPAVAITSASTSSKASTIKREPKVVTTTVKDAKSDSSFFSAPKPKPKLPSFKKAPVPTSATTIASAASVAVKRDQDGNVAQPSSIDPFQEVLKYMKGRNGSPVASTTTASTTLDASVVAAVVVDAVSASDGPRKKRKTVTWAADGQLEQVRLIEKAIYDDDPADGMHTSHSIRDLERGEGAALHAHLFEESIDWYDPPVLELPPEIESQLRPRGIDSQEKDTQEEREKSALSALYISADQIPDTPTEPSSQITLEETDANVKPMLAGIEIQPFFSNATSVADLVSQLRSTGPSPNDITAMGNTMDVVMGEYSTHGQNPAAQGGVDLRGLGLDPNALSLLAQQLALNGLSMTQFQQMAAAVPPVSQAYDQNQSQWAYQPPQGYSDYGGYATKDDHERDRDERDGPTHGKGAWRGRGRGRGDGPGGGAGAGFRGRRKPCTFYAQGRCKFGDACDFSHENPAAYY